MFKRALRIGPVWTNPRVFINAPKRSHIWTDQGACHARAIIFLHRTGMDLTAFRAGSTIQIFRTGTCRRVSRSAPKRGLTRTDITVSSALITTN